MIQLNKPYKCKYCGVVFVVLEGRYEGSYLPVELITGDEKHDGIFDKDKHVSHLKNCPAMQATWEGSKKQIRDQARREERAKYKDVYK